MVPKFLNHLIGRKIVCLRIEDQREGTYHLVYFTASEDSEAIKGLIVACIKHNILRHIVVRREDRVCFT